MDESKPSIWFFGDLGDSFVALIADSAPGEAEVGLHDAAGPLPGLPHESGEPPGAVVVHRNSLATADLKMLEHWRSRLGSRTPIVLCVSPFARYAEIARANRVVNAVVPEATAVDSLAHRLARLMGFDEPGGQPSYPFRIEVSSGLYEMGRVMVEACSRAGFKAELVDDLIEISQARGKRGRDRGSDRVLTIWDVPLLERGWRGALEVRVRATGPVIAVFAFADRGAVTSAWDAGAAACLDSPGDFELLTDVVSWIARSYPIERWPVPARLERAHAVPPSRKQGSRSIVANDESRPPGKR